MKITEYEFKDDYTEFEAFVQPIRKDLSEFLIRFYGPRSKADCHVWSLYDAILNNPFKEEKESHSAI